MAVATRPILRLQGVSKHFGGVRALHEVSFDVPEGVVFSVIGPNGAGKTSLFNVITGFYPASSGSVLFRSETDMTRSGMTWLPWKRGTLPMRPDEVTRLGIARTFQTIRLFRNLTVLDNVVIGGHIQTQVGFPGILFRSAAFRAEEASLRDDARRHLEFVGLSHREADHADDLSYGEQRRLEIARSLMARPQLLLLDEPVAGMNSTETAELMALIRSINGSGITVLLIEHDMRMVMEISEEIVVLDHGERLAQGPPEAIRNDERVIAAYLGEVSREKRGEQ